MDKIIVENFRCFGRRQEARLAPLTLLVGENGTGKSSFMAMVRALWKVARSPDRFADFSTPPFELGFFDDLVNEPGGKNGQARSFVGGFEATPTLDLDDLDPWGLEVLFSNALGHAATRQWRLTLEDVSLELKADQDDNPELVYSTSNGKWKIELDEVINNALGIKAILPGTCFRLVPKNKSGFLPTGRSREIEDEDFQLFSNLAEHLFALHAQSGLEPFADAPIRSRPRRTFDRSLEAPNPEGHTTPQLLAGFARSGSASWSTSKRLLEAFGHELGIFDELRIRPLGERESDPFQVQVRKHHGKRKGPWRNLVDAGHGVSQVLPLLVEFVCPTSPPMYLLQQPEAYLHPSAQAELATIFCAFAGQGKRLLVETHSDHILDRVRMDVRDGATALKSCDVSILFFERHSRNVIIHSIRLDDLGNVLDAPDGYRQFFMEETKRSLGL